MSQNLTGLGAGVAQRLAARRLSRRTVLKTAVVATVPLLPYTRPHLTSLGAAVAQQVSGPVETADIEMQIDVYYDRTTEGARDRAAIATTIEEYHGSNVHHDGGSSYVKSTATFTGVIDWLVTAIHDRLRSLLVDPRSFFDPIRFVRRLF